MLVLIISPLVWVPYLIMFLHYYLGVVFDSDVQVTKVVQSCFAQLRQLTKIKSFLSPADLEKVIRAFISSRLDYCNALYSGIILVLVRETSKDCS